MGMNAALPHLLLISQQPGAAIGPLSKEASSHYSVHHTSNALDAVERLESGLTADVIFIDLPPDDDEVRHTLRWIEKLRPDVPVILLSNADRSPFRTLATGLEARESVVKPLSEDLLQRIVEQHLRDRLVKCKAATNVDPIEDIGEELYFVAASPGMRKIRRQAELLAKLDAPILIVGESGCGKQVLAQLIHKLSPRAQYKFAGVNCAALPANLLERELFGCSGDSGPRSGKFELCHKGTILLDEFTAMPPRQQAKLLSVLHDKNSSSLNTEETNEVDVRVLATTNENLEKALAEKRLREDLYYRLSAFTIEMPPLRERKDELELLLKHFMNRVARHYGLPRRSFSDSVIAACHNYSWPGNLRELENFVKRYLVMGDEHVVLSEMRTPPNTRVVEDTARDHNSDTAGRDGLENREETEGQADGLKTLVRSIKDQTEKDAISSTLERTGWNRKQAARVLRISYRSLLYKIEQYHLTKPAVQWPSETSNGGKGSSPDHRSLAVNTHSASSHR